MFGIVTSSPSTIVNDIISGLILAFLLWAVRYGKHELVDPIRSVDHKLDGHMAKYKKDKKRTDRRLRRVENAVQSTKGSVERISEEGTQQKSSR